MRLQAMVGYKLFKELEDGTIDLIRIVNCRKYKEGNPSEIVIRNEATKEIKKVRVDSLSDYTPLEPDGLMTFNIVNLKTEDGSIVKDVIITVSKILNIKIGDLLPYAVCRQNITDIFYNLLCKTEDDMMVGLAVNNENCPANFNFEMMLACNGIAYSESVNFYRTDLIEDIMKMIKVKKFDDILSDLYSKHVDYVGDPSLMMKLHHKGWTKNLDTLLKNNNFQTDVDQMLGITHIEPVLNDYIVEKSLPNGDKYSSLEGDIKLWISSLFKIAINDITLLEYDHDINLAEFNNARYLLLRDGSNKLYLAVYTITGEYNRSDLEAEANKKDFSTEFRINFYNKYNNIK